MERIILNNGHLSAIFLPEKGMRLISFKDGSVEMIDPKHPAEITGPYFGERYPHLPHGIGRYAPWKFMQEGTVGIEAELSGKQIWQNKTLAEQQGQNFTMRMAIHLEEQRLKFSLSIVSDTDSLIGMQLPFRLPAGKKQLSSTIQPYSLRARKETISQSETLQKLPRIDDRKSVNIRNMNQLTIVNPRGFGAVSDAEVISLRALNSGRREKIPLEKFGQEHQLLLDCQEIWEATLFPFPDPLVAKVELKTEEYCLQISYRCRCQENCWSIISNEEKFSISPLSSQDPFHPNLSVSAIEIDLGPITEVLPSPRDFVLFQS